MSKGYSGRQSRLRPSIIKAVDGYLGSFHQTLNLGDTQIKVFGSKDDGPFWMMPTEIDINNLGNYTASGKRNELVFIYTEFSLKYLLGSCQVIEEEESLLQAQGTSLGVTVDQTQKCHHELAGEGIQYSWGCAENYY